MESSQRNNEFREPMPDSSSNFNQQKDNNTPTNGKAEVSITSSDLTHLVHIPKNINP